jgi:RIO kinase 1
VIKKEETAEFLEEFKIERKVFDKRTLFSVFKLMKKGYIKTLESIVKEGKESVVVSGKDENGNWIAIKVYRVLYVDFKNMWKYLVGDPRFKRIKKDRWFIVINWAKREFKNLQIAFKGKVSCPKPIAVNENVLVTSFIGEDGVAAPTLIEIKLDDYQEIYNFIVKEMKKLAKIKLVHSDLSPYNILIYDKPYLIDFSQAVTHNHPHVKKFLRRDVKNINNYFKKFGVNIKENLFEDLVKIMELR